MNPAVTTELAKAAPTALPVREFLALPRQPARSWVGTPDGRTVVLAEENGLLLTGPTGAAKSLTEIDLAARLAASEPSSWLGLSVCGGLNVLMLLLEGADEDNRDRLAQLVPPSALDRLFIVDRWRGRPTPRADEDGLRDLAWMIADNEIDVVAFDTLPAFYAGTMDLSKGLPEEAFQFIEDLRRRSGRRFGWIGTAHTRKADRSGAVADEVEEIAGAIAKKADGAIVIRRDGDRGDQRRRIIFAKVRRGPELEDLIAGFPTDPNAPPRLSPITEIPRDEATAERRRKVIAYVAEHPGCAREEAVKAAGGNAKKTRAIVRDLLTSGELDEGEGGKGLVPASDTGLPPRPEGGTQEGRPDAGLDGWSRPEPSPVPLGTGRPDADVEGDEDAAAEAEAAQAELDRVRAKGLG